MSEPEPEAHCYDCPNKHGKCAEYMALNLGWIKMGLGHYDRGHCRWGAESIKKEKAEAWMRCAVCGKEIVTEPYRPAYIKDFKRVDGIACSQKCAIDFIDKKARA